MRRLIAALFTLVLLLPAAAYAQDGRPTKPPPGVPTLAPPVVPIQTEEAELAATLESSPAQLRADLRPQLGMELFSAAFAPDFFDGQTVAGGDKYIDVGGDCIPGYTAVPASLGMVWVADSGPVTFTFTPEDATEATAFLIWEMQAEQWWCNVDFFDTPTYNFNNMGVGIYFIWLLTPQPTLTSGALDISISPQ